MDESRTQDMTEQYVGPSALRIANLLPHRVSFDRGWSWTTTAICHGAARTGTASTCGATPGSALPAW